MILFVRLFYSRHLQNAVTITIKYETYTIYGYDCRIFQISKLYQLLNDIAYNSWHYENTPMTYDRPFAYIAKKSVRLVIFTNDFSVENILHSIFICPEYRLWVHVRNPIAEAVLTITNLKHK